MSLIESFQKHWEQQFPNYQPQNTHLLLAISGGVDSVVLLDLVKQLGFSYSVAHCNFQLRGADSDRDEHFVKTLAGEATFFVKHFDTAKFALEEKIAIQEAARKLRYDWFQHILVQLKQSYDRQIFLVTAHHADDNIETLLMHFFRGTGIAGLRGISAFQKRNALIRPLLCFRKSQLIAYAAEHALEFVEDSSNASDKYTRNFFRNQLIPQIQKVFPDTENNLLENLHRFNEAADIYKEAIDAKLQKLLIKKNAEYHIPILLLQKEKSKSTLTWEIAKQFGFKATQTAEILKLLTAGNGAYIASATHQIIKNRNWLIIAELHALKAMHQSIEWNESPITFASGCLALYLEKKANQSFDKNPAIASLDADKIKFPLLLRKIKTGDYFYPLGMKKKKKISKFLIDLKLSKTQKESIWVLETDKKIIWVIGYRIDDRFKITEQTQKQLTIKYQTIIP